MQQGADLWDLPGVREDEMEEMVLKRWGMTSVFQKVAKEPVREGSYWPVMDKT